jgi:hypothetical protein
LPEVIPVSDDYALPLYQQPLFHKEKPQNKLTVLF